MKNLYKHFLDHEKAFSFVQNSLEEVNALSSAILKSTNFKDGYFFTLLPEDANLERLYEFRGGVILPQNPLIRHKNSNAFYSITPNINSEVSRLIHQKIKGHKDLKGVFDDVIRDKQDFLKQSSKSDPEEFFFELITKILNQELYYIVDESSSSTKLIDKCLWASDASWHSLCVLTTARLEHLQEKELFVENIKEMCANIEMIMICAYDGEGYIFWEKNLDFFP